MKSPRTTHSPHKMQCHCRWLTTMTYPNNTFTWNSYRFSQTMLISFTHQECTTCTNTHTHNGRVPWISVWSASVIIDFAIISHFTLSLNTRIYDLRSLESAIVATFTAWTVCCHLFDWNDMFLRPAKSFFLLAILIDIGAPRKGQLNSDTATMPDVNFPLFRVSLFLAHPQWFESNDIYSRLMSSSPSSSSPRSFQRFQHNTIQLHFRAFAKNRRFLVYIFFSSCYSTHGDT